MRPFVLLRYGEKIVKGSPNPRSYYKCSHIGCCAKKIVERNAHGDILATEYKVKLYHGHVFYPQLILSHSAQGDHSHPAPSTVKVSRFRPKNRGEANVSAM